MNEFSRLCIFCQFLQKAVTQHQQHYVYSLGHSSITSVFITILHFFSNSEPNWHAFCLSQMSWKIIFVLD